jgi:hypothetical protein
MPTRNQNTPEGKNWKWVQQCIEGLPDGLFSNQKSQFG